MGGGGTAVSVEEGRSGALSCCSSCTAGPRVSSVASPTEDVGDPFEDAAPPLWGGRAGVPPQQEALGSSAWGSSSKGVASTGGALGGSGREPSPWLSERREDVPGAPQAVEPVQLAAGRGPSLAEGWLRLGTKLGLNPFLLLKPASSFTGSTGTSAVLEGATPPGSSSSLLPPITIGSSFWSIAYQNGTRSSTFEAAVLSPSAQFVVPYQVLLLLKRRDSMGQDPRTYSS